MICVSISETNPEQIVSIANKMEMVEIRIDLCKLDENTVETVFKNINIPAIATCRPQYCNDKRRAILLKKAIQNGATHVDVEIESATSFKQDVMNFAKQHNCKTIISYHNYENTPSYNELQSIVNDCNSQGADIAKIATTALSEKDSATVLSLYASNSSLVALAMGEYGRITRIANLYLGSPFSFAALDTAHATAGGQLTVEQMIQCKEIL